jgi:amidase
VSLLRDAGGLPFVKTNVPQSLFLPETENNVWGRALNPYNPDRCVSITLIERER